LFASFIVHVYVPTQRFEYVDELAVLLTVPPAGDQLYVYEPLPPETPVTPTVPLQMLRQLILVTPETGVLVNTIAGGATKDTEPVYLQLLPSVTV
jgi:hypothetical protein